MDGIAFSLCLGGTAIILLATFFVYKRHPVSTGQTVLFGVGAALIMITQIVDIEWGDGKFKFTKNETTNGLASQVSALADQQTKLLDQVDRVQTAIAETARQLDAVKKSIALAQPSINLPTTGTLSPSFLKDLNESSSSIRQGTANAKARLEVIQSETMPAYYSSSRRGSSKSSTGPDQ